MFSPNEIAGREYGGDNFAGLFDSIKTGLQSVIPAKTVVGKALAGDYAGAAAGVLKSAAPGTPKAVSVPGPTGGITPIVPAVKGDNTMLYVGLGAAALLGGFLLLRSK